MAFFSGILSPIALSAESAAFLYASVAILFAFAFSRYYNDTNRADLNYIPMPVSIHIYPSLSSLSVLLLQAGASWIWGHEKIIFDRSTSTAYTEWYGTLQTCVIRIKGALFVSGSLIICGGDRADYPPARPRSRNLTSYVRSPPALFPLMTWRPATACGCGPRRYLTASFIVFPYPFYPADCFFFCSIMGKMIYQYGEIVCRP